MQAPACDSSDFCMALRAESTLLIPEIAKSAGTPKRFQHVSPFAFFEVGFIGWIVRVGFALYLDVSFDGSALGVVQPDFIWPSFVIADLAEEGLSEGFERSVASPLQPRRLRATGRTVRSISSLSDNHSNSFQVAIRLADQPSIMAS